MKQTLKIFLLFFLFLAVLYYPTRNSGFVTDFLGWQMAYDQQPFWQMLNGEGHNIKSFYHFTHILMFFMSKLFGIKGIYWYLVQSGMVAACGILVHTLFKKMSTLFGLKITEGISIIGILFWLSSPYMAEVMVWRAAFHYPLAFAIHIGYVILLLKYIEKQDKKYVFGSIALFIISLFSLEYFFVTPFLVLATLLFVVLNNRDNLALNKPLYLRSFAYFCLIPLSAIGLYVLAYHQIYGKWVPHGRQNDAPFLLADLNSYSTYIKYTVKHLTFTRHLDEGTKVMVFNFIAQTKNAITAAIILLSSAIIGLWRFKKMSGFSKTLFWTFTFYSLWLLPVVSLFFATLLLTENDRYGFTPSVFLMLGVALLLSKLPKPFFYGLSILYIGISLNLTYKTNQQWAQAGKVYWALIDNYKWQNTENVVLLNTPDCLNGMYMFRRGDYISAFADAYDKYKKTNILANTREAMRYNMTNGNDGVYVIMDAPNALRIVINQYGTWWMMRNWGVDNYENEDYKIVVGNGDYRLLLKPPAKKHTFLFHVGTEWKVVDTTKLNVAQR
jgi:hypothetical protein